MGWLRRRDCFGRTDSRSGLLPRNSRTCGSALSCRSSSWRRQRKPGKRRMPLHKGLAKLQVPRMPAFLSVGRQEHWLDMDPRAMSEWAPLAVTLGLTEALRAGRPGYQSESLRRMSCSRTTACRPKQSMWGEAAPTIAFPLPNGDPLGHQATTVRLANGLPGISSTSGRPRFGMHYQSWQG